MSMYYYLCSKFPTDIRSISNNIRYNMLKIYLTDEAIYSVKTVFVKVSASTYLFTVRNYNTR